MHDVAGAAQPNDDVPLSEFDRLVAELVREPPAARVVQLDEVQAQDAELARRLRRRLRVLDEFGLLADPQPATRPVAAPASIGGYRILRQLGSGGMGVVWLAEQPDLGRRVAIKVLHQWRLPSERARERFRREALAAGRLDHPGLCPIYDVGEADGVPFLVMRHVPGRTLGERIDLARQQRAPCVLLGSGADAAPEAAADPAASMAGSGDAGTVDAAGGAVAAATRGGVAGGSRDADGAPLRASDEREPRPVLAIVGFVEKLARAIDVAHRTGLVHRDLKPANVMVEPDGTPVVLDFGLARDTSADAMTLSGDHVGTPVYMAPEQIGAVCSDSIGPRADVYALGVILYECLTLQLPCPATDRDALYRATLRGAAADAARSQRRLPRDLRVVLAKAMDPDPERRYASAQLLADDLRRYRERQPILAQPPGLLLRARRWSERNPVVAASLALLTAGLAGTLVLSHQLTVALRHARSVELAHLSREEQASSTLRAHLLALEAVAAEENVETVSQLHATVAEVREQAELRHGAVVADCALSGDGQRVVTVGEDGCARLWTVRGEQLTVLPPHIHPGSGKSMPLSLALIAQDGRIVTADAAGVAKLWSPHGQPIRDLYPTRDDQPRHALRKGTLHGPTGRLMLIGDHGLALWWPNLEAEEPVQLRCPDEPLQTCAMSADGERFGFAVSHRPVFAVPTHAAAFVWHASPRRLVELRGHRLSILGMAFGEGCVFTSSQDGTLRRWTDEGALTWSQEGKERLQGLALSPDGRTVVVANHVGNVFAWRSDGSGLQWSWQHHTQVQHIRFSADGQRLMVGAIDGSLRILDHEGRELCALNGHDDFITSSAGWSSDQQLLVTTSHDYTARVWRSEPVLPGLVGHRDAVRALALSPDGRRLASGAFDGVVRIWDVSDPRQPRELAAIDTAVEFGDTQITCIAWHPRDADELLVCSNNQVARRIDVRRHEPRQRYDLRGDFGTGFRSFFGAYSRDGGTLLLAGRAGNGKVRCVDLGRGTWRDVATGGTSEITALAVSPDGRQFAVGRWMLPQVVDLSGKVRLRLSAHEDRVSALAFSPDRDGSRLLTGSYDRVVRLWDVARDPPCCRTELRGHAGSVTSVAWSPDGSCIATASKDGTARLWSPYGEPIALLRAHQGAVWAVSFSADGRYLFTAGEDRTIRTWFVDLADLLAAAKALAVRPLSADERNRYGSRLR